MGATRDKVFISYSHKDQKWLDEFRPFLSVYDSMGLAAWIDNTSIPKGSVWKDEIDQALSSARVAVLLVSTNYLASQFILQEELRPILVTHKRQGLSLIWVYLSACQYEQTPIAQYQCAHRAANPLDTLRPAVRKAHWKEIGARVYEAFQNRPMRLSPPTGGGIAHDDPLYVERRCDSDLRDALAAHEFLVLLKGNREMGKTSVLARSLAYARSQGYRTIHTDCQRLSDEERSSGKLFGAVAEDAAEQLKTELPSHHRDGELLLSEREFEKFIQNQVLRPGMQHLVWVIDEAERLSYEPFIALLRRWRKDRTLSQESPWLGLTLIMVYATESFLAGWRPYQPPFTIGANVPVSDLSLQQIRSLNDRHGQPLSDTTSLEDFYAYLGGHPHLTRVGLWELTDIGMDELKERAPLEDGPFAGHLHYLREMLGRYTDLPGAARRLMEGSAVSKEELDRLRWAGIAAGATPAKARLRCGLYRTVLEDFA